MLARVYKRVSSVVLPWWWLFLMARRYTLITDRFQPYQFPSSSSSRSRSRSSSSSFCFPLSFSLFLFLSIFPPLPLSLSVFMSLFHFQSLQKKPKVMEISISINVALKETIDHSPIDKQSQRESPIAWSLHMLSINSKLTSSIRD